MAIVNRPSSSSSVALLIAGVASLVILTVLNPQLVFSSTTPAGGDMGAHVLGPAYLRDVLLPEGKILGWSDSWFAGFPAFYFYFPLPSLFIVFLDLFLPYGVAFKLVTVVGLVGLPPAVLYLGRSLGFNRTVAAMGAAAGAVFALMESYTIYGGNVASTMAGEFAYSWSFTLGFVYLGLLIRSIKEDRKYVPWAVVFLAATVLSHILTTLVLVMASLTVLVWKKAWRPALTIWLWAFAITAFWSVPLIARIGLTSDMSWTPLTRWEEVFPLELWLLIPFAFGGLVYSIVRHPRALPVAAATLIPIIYYPLPSVLTAAFGHLEGERWKLWNGRLLPYWYFGIVFFAAVAIGSLVVWASRRLPDRVSGWWPRALGVAVAAGVGWLLVFREGPVWAGWALAALGVVVAAASLSFMAPVATRAVLATAVAGTLIFGSLAGTNFVFKWSRWNYSGYEAKEAWPEYDAVMGTMSDLPPGRIQWEQDSTAGTGLDKYGTPMAPMLFPYWTDWNHPSMEGLFFESSLTTPFMFLASNELSLKGSTPVSGLEYHPFDFERGVRHMELFGVRYYVSYSPEAAEKADEHPDLTLVAESPPFRIYELSTVSVVDALGVQPAVYVQPDMVDDGEAEDFDAFALDWYGTMDALDHIVVTDGPEAWQRASHVDEMERVPTDVAANDVSNVSVGNEEVSFDTTAVGVPHLVKVSYFPNWTVSGAEGPYRATPSLMVVVPTESHVTMRFQNTWAENVGNVATVLGLLGLLGLGLSRFWRPRRARHLPGRAPADLAQ